MASTQFIALFKVYEFLLNRAPSNKSFDDRLLVQKTGYLSSLMGIYLGEIEIRWNWYRRGPYSSALASILYEIDDIANDELDSISRQYTLIDAAKENFCL